MEHVDHFLDRQLEFIGADLAYFALHLGIRVVGVVLRRDSSIIIIRSHRGSFGLARQILDRKLEGCVAEHVVEHLVVVLQQQRMIADLGCHTFSGFERYLHNQLDRNGHVGILEQELRIVRTGVDPEILSVLRRIVDAGTAVLRDQGAIDVVVRIRETACGVGRSDEAPVEPVYNGPLDRSDVGIVVYHRDLGAVAQEHHLFIADQPGLHVRGAFLGVETPEADLILDAGREGFGFHHHALQRAHAIFGEVKVAEIGHEVDADRVVRHVTCQGACRGGRGGRGGELSIADCDVFALGVEAEHLDRSDGFLFAGDVALSLGLHAVHAELYGHLAVRHGCLYLFRDVDAAASQDHHCGCKKEYVSFHFRLRLRVIRIC